MIKGFSTSQDFYLIKEVFNKPRFSTSKYVFLDQESFQEAKILTELIKKVFRKSRFFTLSRKFSRCEDFSASKNFASIQYLKS